MLVLSRRMPKFHPVRGLGSSVVDTAWSHGRAVLVDGRAPNHDESNKREIPEVVPQPENKRSTEAHEGMARVTRQEDQRQHPDHGQGQSRWRYLPGLLAVNIPSVPKEPVRAWWRRCAPESETGACGA